MCLIFPGRGYEFKSGRVNILLMCNLLMSHTKQARSININKHQFGNIELYDRGAMLIRYNVMWMEIKIAT